MTYEEDFFEPHGQEGEEKTEDSTPGDSIEETTGEPGESTEETPKEDSEEENE